MAPIAILGVHCHAGEGPRLACFAHLGDSLAFGQFDFGFAKLPDNLLRAERDSARGSLAHDTAGATYRPCCCF